jgi:hypothetical protein
MKFVSTRSVSVLTRSLSLALIIMTSTASMCEKEMPEPPVDNGGNGSGSCGTYTGPSGDPQLDSFCQAAYAYRCLDGLPVTSQQVRAVCDIYNDIKEPNVPNCPYCQ